MRSQMSERRRRCRALCAMSPSAVRVRARPSVVGCGVSDGWADGRCCSECGDEGRGGAAESSNAELPCQRERGAAGDAPPPSAPPQLSVASPASGLCGELQQLSR